MGTYWSETGASLRPTEIVYDRGGSAFVKRDDASWDWPVLLSGAEHLHLSGITVAVGEDTTRSAVAAARAAVTARIPVSFDGNYRERLWADRTFVDVASLRELAEAADILFGDHRDVSLLLGHKFAGDTPNGRRKAAEAAFAAFPRLKLMASTVRVSAHVGEYALSARIDVHDEGFETEPLVIPGVIDRIGSGDAFVAGVLHAMWRADGIEQIARNGLALGALKHSVAGDTSWITERQLAAFSTGSMDVRR
jgi:2-dehydro-3-deoxygluconokinase